MKKVKTMKGNEFLPQPLIFQPLNSVRSKNRSLKYRRFASPGCEDKGIRKFEFVTQFLYHYYLLK